MAIVFQCDNCGRRYRVRAEQAGQRGKCRNCNANLVVPSGPPVEALESGQVVYRHQPRERGFELAAGDPEGIEAIEAHIRDHLGEIETVYHELISDLVHIDIHLVPPTAQRPFYCLVTSGMSDRPMEVPDGAEDFRYAEVMICLPSDWPLSEKAFKDESNYWPVRLLKVLARFPHEYQTWLGPGHTVPNGDPPASYAPNTKFCCAMLLPPVSVVEDFWELEVQQDKKIRFYQVVPLYEEETNFKLKHGMQGLVDRFSRAQSSPIVDVKRKNTCRRRFGLF